MYWLIVSIYPPDSRKTFVVDVWHAAIVTQTQFRKYLQYFDRLFFYLLFFSIYAAVKQTPVLVFHATLVTYQKISV